MYVIYSLENCPFSMRANETFSGKGKIISILRKNKENYKKLMNTFPQIYYVTKNDACLLGGINDFEKMVKTNNLTFKIKPKNNDTINKIKNTFKNFSI